MVNVVLGAGIAILLFWKHRQIAEAIEAFRNKFPRGGPRTPMHPSPTGDGALLRRGRSRKRGSGAQGTLDAGL